MGPSTISKSSLAEKRTEVLLTLRGCARSWPASLGRKLGLPRTTAGHHIKKLEEEGTITGYTPIVKPEFFGEPYLIRIPINPDDYQFERDSKRRIDTIIEFLNERIDHAPISFFVLSDDKKMIVNCVTLTRDCNKLVNRLEVELNIAQDDITISELNRIEGVPNYGLHSILREGQEVVKR